MVVALGPDAVFAFIMLERFLVLRRDFVDFVDFAFVVRFADFAFVVRFADFVFVVRFVLVVRFAGFVADLFEICAF